DSSARPAERPSVLLPWTQRQSSESDLARRSGRMPVYQAAGAGPLPVAERSRRRGDDLFRTAWLPALRYRLASSAGNLASDLCRLTGFACRSYRFCFNHLMKAAADSLPSDLAPAHAMILAERHARLT